MPTYAPSTVPGATVDVPEARGVRRRGGAGRDSTRSPLDVPLGLEAAPDRRRRQRHGMRGPRRRRHRRHGGGGLGGGLLGVQRVVAERTDTHAYREQQNRDAYAGQQAALGGLRLGGFHRRYLGRCLGRCLRQCLGRFFGCFLGAPQDDGLELRRSRAGLDAGRYAVARRPPLRSAPQRQESPLPPLPLASESSIADLLRLAALYLLLGTPAPPTAPPLSLLLFLRLFLAPARRPEPVPASRPPPRPVPAAASCPSTTIGVMIEGSGGAGVDRRPRRPRPARRARRSGPSTPARPRRPLPRPRPAPASPRGSAAASPASAVSICSAVSPVRSPSSSPSGPSAKSRSSRNPCASTETADVDDTRSPPPARPIRRCPTLVPRAAGHDPASRAGGR